MTLVIMLMSQSFFWKREVWCIENFDEDKTIPYDSLPEELKKCAASCPRKAFGCDSKLRLSEAAPAAGMRCWKIPSKD